MITLRLSYDIRKVSVRFRPSLSPKNRKVIVSNVNTNVVAYSRLRCRKNCRENRRQINRTTTVANVTEA